MVLYYILVPLAWLVWHIGFRIRVEGRENLKKVQTKGYILAPTHVSAIDPVFIVVTRWGRRMVVFAKKELFEISALLSWFFRCCGGVCVRGTKDEMAVISQTVEACKQGKTLLIFPEGTREKDGKLLPPKSGLFVIAAEAGVDVVPCRIHLMSEDPDGLKGINMEKVTKARRMSYPIIKPYQDQLENRQQWCIAAVPGAAWAKKVFPGERTGTAMEKLWEAILFTSRVTDDPEKAWADHDKDLQERCDYLNSLGIRSLHYTADNGTDFTVGMIPEGRFCGGGETARTGIFFNPNIPTEECFVSPMKGQAEGIVYATKPLSYRGQLIEGFSIRFAGGKAVEVHAEKGEDLLKAMISMDEGAAYLGECALVPQASPIAESGLLFYNTLFDENAACHLALGMGFPDTIADFQNKTLEECRSLGINDSMIHEDFMIGCDSMNIDALCADGSTKPIFRNGNWAF